MAKSSRASTIKKNNQRLKKNVFGPVEAARAERLSAKLLALAAQPKPQRDVEMNEAPTDESKDTATEKMDTMDVDGAKPASKKPNSKRKRVEKRRGKKSSIVFPTRGPKRNKK
ncbi:7e3172d8-42e1-492b-a18a-687595617700 [Thermothielavioides terrestris]|uniref:7e3172d8-42e1-492b-a18a-687595617700 n=1 Tax=Thermothielavioides terrestris TaxID=2587410 RepID=A0A446BU47_9PEZI|nr:7e3172d8-42e1-492b-a18a-687595617700 [Thermothielavioides terrestris]